VTAAPFFVYKPSDVRRLAQQRLPITNGLVGKTMSRLASRVQQWLVNFGSLEDRVGRTLDEQTQGIFAD
jgi:uncharacterized membrane protein YheB (UPF0754 family)